MTSTVTPREQVATVTPRKGGNKHPYEGGGGNSDP